ncbi:unnamed protein product [Coregonus sp. 'balchen']|nr:unnamed protein product [Coregonus sp. 'balchen']
MPDSCPLNRWYGTHPKYARVYALPTVCCVLDVNPGPSLIGQMPSQGRPYWVGAKVGSPILEKGQSDDSQEGSGEERQGEETPIIPLFRIIVPVVWDEDADIQQAQRTEPAPAQRPENRAYVLTEKVPPANLHVNVSSPEEKRPDCNFDVVSKTIRVF